MNTKFHLNQDYANPWGFGLYILQENIGPGGKERAIALPIQMKALADAPGMSGVSPTPVITLDAAELQNLMDELWRNGIRPNKNLHEQPAFEALNAHLADMRTIVFEHFLKK